MAFVTVPDVAEVHVRGTLGGQLTENTFFYRAVGDITHAMLQDLCDTVATKIVDDMLGLFPSDWVGREVYARDLSAAAGAEASSDNITGVSGTAGAAAPNNATLAVQRYSGLTGRSARGRIYWQGLPTSFIDSTNTLDPTFTSGIISNLEALDDDLRAADWTPVVVSFFTDGAERAIGVAFEIVAWRIVDNIVDSMRRRLPGRGR